MNEPRDATPREELLISGFAALRAAVSVQLRADPVGSLRSSALRYREFALQHPATYRLMFGGGIASHEMSPAVAEQAAAVFDEFAGLVRSSMTAGELAPGDPLAVTQQIWSTLHGAVQLESAGLLRLADAERAYRDLFDALIRGLRCALPLFKAG
jgi:AcrR family transcriptional regulator